MVVPGSGARDGPAPGARGAAAGPTGDAGDWDGEGDVLEGAVLRPDAPPDGT